MTESVQGIVREAQNNYVYGTTHLGEYVDFSMYQTVERISAYINSRHTSGLVDSLGREKPFFNIVTAAINVWYRATDIDRKDITIRPDKNSNVAVAFLATILLQDWMKRNQFGVFLNQWGRILSQYGSAVVKFVERDGNLIPSVIPWSRLIVDPISFNSIPRIEKFYKTPAQLKNMATPGHPDYAGYDMVAVEQLLDSVATRKNMDGTQKDLQADFIELYEVHGEMPLSLLTGNDEDDDNFRQQMHVVSFMAGKDQDEWDDFTLFKGKEKRDPYMITHLIEEDGRTLAIGAVEYLFDAQWMQNHTVKNMKDLLDLTSKLVFQTADKGFVGRNVLSAIETGDILIYEGENGISQINDGKAADVSALQAFSTQWQQMAQTLTSTPDALRGTTLPSGTPYSLASFLGSQANSLFEIMTENKGLAIEAMLREFVIPHLKSKLNNDKEIAATLEDYDLQKLDAMYVPKEAIRRHNEDVKAAVLNGDVPSPYQPNLYQQSVKQDLGPLGNRRFLSPGDVNWAEAFKDFEWEAEVGVTNESADKQVVLTSLTTLLQSIATNPAILQDPNARLVFNKILSYTGVVSPVELSIPASQPAPQPAPPAPGQGAPQEGGMGMGGALSALAGKQ
jgi:hypothetical protein